MFLGVGLSLLMKGMEGLAVVLVQWSFGLSLPFYSSILVVAAVSLATFLPFSPGRVGIFEGAVYWAYKYLGLDDASALTLALFIHVVHSFPLILIGYGVSLKQGFHWKKVSFFSDENGTKILAGEA